MSSLKPSPFQSTKVIIPLSNRERKLIKMSWEFIGVQWRSICASAYKKWFTSYPELISIFHVEKFKTVEEMIECPMMVEHMGHLKRIFSHVVANIFNTNEVHDFLVNLGKRHCAYGAEQKYAQFLGVSLKEYIFLCNSWDWETENAWDSVIQFIMEAIRLGIRNGHQENSKPLCIPSDSIST